MKKQKPAKKRGNPAKQRPKSAAVAARGLQVDPLTSLARTAGPHSSAHDRRKGPRKGATSEPARIGLPAGLMPVKPRASTKAAARALPQSYVWEDREAFAIVCAPFLILALWFTYQQTLRPISAPQPEIAVHRDTGTPAPVVAMAPQTQQPSPSPTPKPVEAAPATPAPSAAAPPPVIAPPTREPVLAIPAPAATEPAPAAHAAPPVIETAPASLASAAPSAAETKPESSLPLGSETGAPVRAIAPTPEAAAASPPLAKTAPPAAPAAPAPVPRVTVKRTPTPAPAAPSVAIEAPQTPVASLAPDRPAPLPPAAVPVAPMEAAAPAVTSPAPAPVEREPIPARPETALPTGAALVSPAPPAPERQQHAALAPVARPEAPPPAPAIAPPVEAPLPPAVSTQPPTSPTGAQTVPTPAPPFDVCEAPATLFAPARTAAPVTPPPAPDFGLALARAARDQLSSLVIYNAKYARIGFPNGDVAPLFGVCTDVVVRAYRMLGLDLQQLIAETKTGRGDRNIDHRRVEVVRRFLALHGETLAITDFAEDYQPGDIVTYYRPQNRTSTQHIAIVSDIVAPSGRYMIVHNRGWGPQLEDALFVDKITGHFRFAGMRKQPDPAPLTAAAMASTAPWALITSALVKRDAAAPQPSAAPHSAIVATAAARAAGTNDPLPGQSKPVIASLGAERQNLCRPGDVVTGTTRTAEAPAPAATKPAALSTKPASPAAAKPATSAAVKPAQAKAHPKPLQKAATGTAGKPAPL